MKFVFLCRTYFIYFTSSMPLQWHYFLVMAEECSVLHVPPLYPFVCWWTWGSMSSHVSDLGFHVFTRFGPIPPSLLLRCPSCWVPSPSCWVPSLSCRVWGHPVDTLGLLFSSTWPRSSFLVLLHLSASLVEHWRCSGLFPLFFPQMLPSNLIQAQGFPCLQAVGP